LLKEQRTAAGKAAIFAIAQTVARPSMRALASAIILLTATCFGQGVGPLAVGMINDALKNDYGANAVRYSLLSAALPPRLAHCCSSGPRNPFAETSSGRRDFKLREHAPSSSGERRDHSLRLIGLSIAIHTPLRSRTTPASVGMGLRLRRDDENIFCGT
jgi:hypothetical protein